MFAVTLIYFIIKILVFIFSLTLQIFITVQDVSVWLKTEEIENVFDYVIVGGGSSGSILAARLSENYNATVLLVEAGGYGFDILNVPVLGPLKQLTDLDWQYSTVPQKFSCLGLENNVSRWPSGKILGGSTHLNYMIYMTGNENDYLKWKDPESNHWDSNDISYYYKKASHHIESSEKESGGCSARGTILVRKDPPHTTELSEAVLQAASELKYGVHDLNSEASTGFMKPQLNMNELGRRWTSDQYLNRIKSKRPNLKILTNAVAKKILFRDGFEAYAVEVNRKGRTELIFAKVEIILSAGTVGSAKLLQLSGVGPAEVLDAAKVQQKVDLPVGKNLQDHVTTGLDLVLLNKTLFSFTDLLYPLTALRYLTRGTGPLTSGLVEAVGLLRSPLAENAEGAPDLEFMVMAAGLSSDKGAFLRRTMGISEKMWNAYFGQLLNESAVSIIPVLLHPRSVGTVTLDPLDPEGPPRIDPMYLAEEADVRILVEGLKIVQKMVDTRALRALGARLNERKVPGCEGWKFGSKAYWKCYVRRLTLTVYHPVGTCRMGTAGRGGVVDHRLRVYGTNRLRVVDASVMPNLPSGNTNAAVVMIAEKAADLIKEDFIRRRSSCRLSEILSRTSMCPAPDPAHLS